jgi:hypothetical protein
MAQLVSGDLRKVITWLRALNGASTRLQIPIPHLTANDQVPPKGPLPTYCGEKLGKNELRIETMPGSTCQNGPY